MILNAVKEILIISLFGKLKRFIELAYVDNEKKSHVSLQVYFLIKVFKLTIIDIKHQS